MQESTLFPRHYLDYEVFTRELEHLFHRRQWHLIGLARDLPAHNDYVVRRIGTREVIVQNFDGELRAFTNVCPHRFSALRTEPSGNGPLRCGYHLWTFDAAGSPCAVPNRVGLSLDECRRSGRSLDRWELATIGEFVFVSREPVAALTEYLGPLAEALATIASGFAEEVATVDQEIRANWKVIIQNTIEFDHVFSVHPETFSPIVEKPLRLVEHPAAEPHLAYHAALAEVERSYKPIELRIGEIYERSLVPMVLGYLHYLLFPTVTIGTTVNRQFALITYQPVAPDRTHARARLFLPTIKDRTELDKTIMETVSAHDVAFTKQLLDEDRAICETVQRGIANAPPDMRGALMPGESLVGKFQVAYHRAMGD